MGLAPSLKKVSAKFIKQFGNDLILTKVTEGAYNPATGEAAKTTTTITTKAIDEDYISEHSAAGDMMVTFVSDVEVDAFDTATYRGRTREIKPIKQVAIQNSTIIYQAVLSGDARRMV